MLDFGEQKYRRTRQDDKRHSKIFSVLLSGTTYVILLFFRRESFSAGDYSTVRIPGTTTVLFCVVVELDYKSSMTYDTEA